MHNFYKTVLAAILFPLFTLAQSNYKPALVINLKGDTVHGFIDYKEWDKNPKNINFKSSLNAPTTEVISSKNAAGFAITGLEFYQRSILSISIDQIDISKLATRLDTSAVVDTVFLKVIAKGKYLTLFRYSDDIKRRFFIQEAGELQPEELIYRAYYSADISSSVQYINRYRNQLEYLAQRYAANSAKLSEQILEANYNEPDLIKIVQIINGSSSQQYASPSLTGSRWFAGAGVSYSDLKFTTTGGTTFTNSTTTHSNSISPKLTGGIDFFPNKNVQRILLRAEFSFTINQYDISNTNNTTTPQSTNSLKFTQYNYAITPQIIYNVYNKERLKTFIGVGAGLNFSAYNQYQYITKYEGSFPDVIQNNYPAFDKFRLSIPITAGITLNNKIEFSIGYIPSSSLQKDNGTFLSDVTVYQAGINYLFGK
ncbi:MAG TPA: outer membrane beta-barrel protein [Mucilaginibacter sp.]|jgi:hypothetical protein